jgi:hypothetical protein
MDCRITNPTNFTGIMMLVNGGGAIEQPMTAGAHAATVCARGCNPMCPGCNPMCH